MSEWEKISSDKKKVMASEANTSPEILLRLADEYPEVVLKNPALNLIALENSNIYINIKQKAERIVSDKHITNLLSNALKIERLQISFHCTLRVQGVFENSYSGIPLFSRLISSIKPLPDGSDLQKLAMYQNDMADFLHSEARSSSQSFDVTKGASLKDAAIEAGRSCLYASQILILWQATAHEKTYLEAGDEFGAALGALYCAALARSYFIQKPGIEALQAGIDEKKCQIQLIQEVLQGK
jgi:hypothetical protein